MPFPARKVSAGPPHCLAHLVSFGRHTVSALLRAQNRHPAGLVGRLPSFIRRSVDEQAVFDQIRLAVERPWSRTNRWCGDG